MFINSTFGTVFLIRSSDGAVVVSTSTAAWRKIGPYVKSYLSNLLHVSPLLISERLLRMVCAHMSKLRHMFSPFTKLQNKLAKVNFEFLLFYCILCF
jgi:hypothetical protein